MQNKRDKLCELNINVPPLSDEDIEKSKQLYGKKYWKSEEEMEEMLEELVERGILIHLEEGAEIDLGTIREDEIGANDEWDQMERDEGTHN